MLKMLLPLMTVLLLWQRAASMEELCRECLCANSGGRIGDVASCVMPVSTDCLDGVYCGPYGMTIQYWMDAGQPGDNFFDCMGDWSCANKTLDNYVNKYCQTMFVGHSAPCSCEEQVRLHHCGPYSIHAAFCNTFYDNYFEPCIRSA
ncbi:lysozyme-like [Amphibalanus amphitrite]|uniref:lysozyme-like n=1 Tax=Amphibalanus amphitrite TaxID=1232801 RepID=UPI001C908C88|nr:lysozyme-like [Amphibalanus amphitrite]